MFSCGDHKNNCFGGPTLLSWCYLRTEQDICNGFLYPTAKVILGLGWTILYALFWRNRDKKHFFNFVIGSENTFKQTELYCYFKLFF